MEAKHCIGIPRSLMFYRYYPFWHPFFEGLGWRVVVSDGTGKRGNVIYFEDSCLPMKLLVTHSMDLVGKVEHLFVPRLVSLHSTAIMCPKFRGAPDIIRLATEGKVSVIDETIDLREDSLLASFIRIGQRLGASKKESKRAFQQASSVFSRFQREWSHRINRLPTREIFKMDIPTPWTKVKESLFQVALVGHPYNLFDVEINKDILGLMKDLGMEILTSDRLSESEIHRQVSDLSKEIYWSSGREIVGSLFHFLRERVDGVIFLTSFKCGIDALLQEFIKRRLRIQRENEVPFLILSFDEHTGREGLITRLEAFRDLMEQRKSGCQIVI
ncbi:MAG: acyl-CoA dehydratase activase-related protein [Thermodesulfobacteriota bacterium]